MKSSYIFFSLLILTSWFGCKRASESIPKGAYAYTCFDNNGVALVSGWFTVIVADSTTVSGEWHFEAIGNPQKIGPQTGDGKLIGGVNGEKVWIELNPKVRNNNLQLNGILARGRVDGQWAWISYDGIMNQGSFKAVRQ